MNIHTAYETLGKAAPVLPMSREERLTRRAQAADSLGLLFTAAYWEAKRDGRADAQDHALMVQERETCIEADWIEFARLDRIIDAEYQARKAVL